MPRVPVSEGSRVSPSSGGLPLLNAQPGARLRTSGFQADKIATPSLNVKAFETGQIDPVRGEAVDGRAQTGAQQMQEFGGSVQRVAGALGGIALDIQNQANEIAVTDALNRAKELQLRLAYDKDQGYTTQLGGAAIVRDSGKSLTDEYVTRFDDSMRAVGEGLKNDAQRRMYAERIGSLRTAFQAGVTQHETEQFKSWNLSTAKAQVETASSELATGYKIPWVTDISNENSPLRDLRDGVVKLGRLQGKSAAEIETDVANALSKAHIGVIQQAVAEGDVMFAAGYMKAHTADITSPDDLLKLHGTIGDAIDTGIGQHVGAEYVGKIGQGAAAVGENDATRLRNLVAHAESGNRERDANGNLITSSAGAQGKMQVIPGTRLDPGFGVKPAKDNSDAERTRVGNDYLDAMLRRYGGDAAKALAAYNWGPGNMDAAAQKYGANWLQAAPAETKRYVASIMKAYTAGGGASEGATYDTVVGDLMKDPRLVGNPKRMAAAVATIKQMHEMSTAAEKDRDERALNAAIEFAALNPGTRYETMPDALKMAVRPKDLPTLNNAVTNLANGSVSNPATIAELEKPGVLASLTDAQFKGLNGTQLNRQDFDRYARLRQELRSPSKMNYDREGMAQTVDRYMTSLGINPSPAKSDTKGQERAAAIRIDIARHIDEVNKTFAVQHGRGMTRSEVEAEIAKHFRSTVTLQRRSVFSGGIVADSDYKLNRYTMKISDIPTESQAVIKQDYRNQGFKENQITDTMILTAYWSGKKAKAR